jgi:CBS domain-containing membrane protein
VELRALSRSHGELTCADIMSRDVVTVGIDDEPSRALNLLLEHNIRTLPVVTNDGVLAGAVGLRELLGETKGRIPVAAAATAFAEQSAATLLPILTDGIKHAVVIVDGAQRVIGIVSQTDLLAGLSRSLSMHTNSRGLVANGGGI